MFRLLSPREAARAPREGAPSASGFHSSRSPLSLRRVRGVLASEKPGSLAPVLGLCLAGCAIFSLRAVSADDKAPKEPAPPAPEERSGSLPLALDREYR